MGVALANAQTATQANVSGMGTQLSVPFNTHSYVDTGLVISANGTIDGFIVSITGNYSNGDVLTYTGSLPSGVSATAFNTASKSLVFSGITTAANWQALLRTVRFRSSSSVCYSEQRQITFSAGNKYYNPVNGHYYEYYTTTGSWTSALAASQSKSYFGRECYIATMTSAAENNFVVNLIGMNTWLGCSDDYQQVNAALGYSAYANQSACDGNFYWVTGPERGMKINSKNAWGSGGITPVSGVYNNWTGGEPNDWPGQNNSSPGEENFGHMYSSGDWNDYANTQNIGTIFEYGGMPNDNVSSQVVYTRTLNVSGAPSGTIIGGNTSVCMGSNVTLSLTGLSGSVVRWQSSNDNFISNSSNITNTTTTLNISGITANTYYRAVVNTSSGCTNLTTASVLITVNTTVPGNIVAVNNTICRFGFAEFDLYGHTGTITKWQKSNNSAFTSGVVDITNTTTSLSFQLNSTGTYYFRAFVQNSGCGSPVATPSYSISVVSGTNPNGGTLSNTEHCGGSSNSGTLSLSGHTGSVSRWEYSTNDGVTWSNILHTGTSYSYSGVGSTRLYRVRLVNGSCGSAYSSEGKVMVYGNTVTRWDGTVSNDWGTNGNWCGGIGDNGIDVIVNPSASNQLVLDQDRTIGNFDFNSSGRYLDIDDYTLTASSISNYNSSSKVKTSSLGSLNLLVNDGASVRFPVGNSGYNPLDVTNNTGSADYISVRVIDEVFNNGLSGFVTNMGRVRRTWDIHKTNANGGSGLDFVFNWSIFETVGLSLPALYHYDSGFWNKQLGSSSYTLTSYTYSGYLGSFSPFAVSNSIVPLPVDLIEFEAKKKVDNQVDIHWISTGETNLSHYELSKSLDGNSWERVGTLKAHNSQGVYEYTLPDLLRAPITYYQLTSIDITGEAEKSEIISVEQTNKLLEPIVYPNPSSGLFSIEAAEDAHFRVINSIGVPVLEGDIHGTTGIEVKKSGIYMLEIVSGEKRYYVQLVVN